MLAYFVLPLLIPHKEGVPVLDPPGGANVAQPDGQQPSSVATSPSHHRLEPIGVAGLRICCCSAVGDDRLNESRGAGCAGQRRGNQPSRERPVHEVSFNVGAVLETVRCAKSRDAWRQHAGAVAERRPGRERQAGVSVRVQHVEDLEIDAGAALPELERLTKPQVQHVCRRGTHRTVRLEPNCDGAERRERRPAVGIGRTELVRPLPQDTDLFQVCAHLTCAGSM